MPMTARTTATTPRILGSGSRILESAFPSPSSEETSNSIRSRAPAPSTGAWADPSAAAAHRPRLDRSPSSGTLGGISCRPAARSSCHEGRAPPPRNGDTTSRSWIGLPPSRSGKSGPRLSRWTFRSALSSAEYLRCLVIWRCQSPLHMRGHVPRLSGYPSTPRDATSSCRARDAASPATSVRPSERRWSINDADPMHCQLD